MKHEVLTQSSCGKETNWINYYIFYNQEYLNFARLISRSICMDTLQVNKAGPYRWPAGSVILHGIRRTRPLTTCLTLLGFQNRIKDLFNSHGGLWYTGSDLSIHTYIHTYVHIYNIFFTLQRPICYSWNLQLEWAFLTPTPALTIKDLMMTSQVNFFIFILFIYLFEIIMCLKMLNLFTYIPLCRNLSVNIFIG